MKKTRTRPAYLPGTALRIFEGQSSDIIYLFDEAMSDMEIIQSSHVISDEAQPSRILSWRD